MRFVTYFHGLDADSLRPVRRPERLPAWLPRGRTTVVPRASHALYLSWRALRLRKGDRFLCPAFTCNTVNLPLEKAGGQPVYFTYVVEFRPEEVGLDCTPGEMKAACGKALAAEGMGMGQWQTRSIPHQDVFLEKVGFGRGVPWSLNPDVEAVYKITPLNFYQGSQAVNGMNWGWAVGLLAAALVFGLLSWILF